MCKKILLYVKENTKILLVSYEIVFPTVSSYLKNVIIDRYYNKLQRNKLRLV